MILAPENCSCEFQSVGASVAASPNCGGTLLVFMALLESFLGGRCDIADPCTSITGADSAADQYDFVVVGGGTAGSVVAARLVEGGYSVLLIEAGGVEPVASRIPSFHNDYLENPEADWMYRSAPGNYCLSESGKGCKFPRGKTLGGSSVLNGMMCNRGREADFEDWASFGVEGWSWEEVYPYYLKFEGNKQVDSLVSSDIHNSDGIMPIQQFRDKPELVDDILIAVNASGYNVLTDLSDPDTPDGFAVAQTFTMGSATLTTARAYLEPLVDNCNLTVLLNSLVTRVLFNDTAAYGVEYIQNNETKQVIAANEVILSAGALNTPQILMLSGIGPKEQLESFNISVISDLPVGENLRNHVGAVLFFTLQNQTNLQTLNWAVAAQYLMNRDGPMSSTGATQLTGFAYSSLANTSRSQPDVQFFFSAYCAQCSANGTVDELVDSTSSGVSFIADGVNILPRSVGRLTLQSADPTVPPLIEPNYFEDEDDKTIIKDALLILKTIVDSEYMQSKYSVILDSSFSLCDNYTAWSDDWLECWVLQYTDAQSHQAGTAALSTVLDSTLQVYNVTGLRVIDASAMPIQVTSNPQATIMMVAERGAEFILSSWSEE